MDQKKIGAFLKQLRKERGITQENLAEVLGVSGRTVSRWETGFNMPDLSLLIEIADYYDVEIKEILDGERKSEIMDKEIKETVLKVADYSNYEMRRLSRRMSYLFIVGTAALLLYFILLMADAGDTFMEGFPAGVLLGLAEGTLIVGVLYTTGLLAKFSGVKKRVFKRLQIQLAKSAKNN